MAAEAASLGAPEIQQSTHWFAIRHCEFPLFGVVIGVDKSKDNVLHVSHLRTQEIGGTNKIKRDGLTVWRDCSDEARLIPCVAVVRHEQASSVQIEHRDRIVGYSSYRHLMHERVPLGCNTQRDLQRLAIHGAFPGTRQSF